MRPSRRGSKVVSLPSATQPPKMPDWILSDEAKRAWDELAPELYASGVAQKNHASA